MRCLASIGTGEGLGFWGLGFRLLGELCLGSGGVRHSLRRVLEACSSQVGHLQIIASWSSIRVCYTTSKAHVRNGLGITSKDSSVACEGLCIDRRIQTLNSANCTLQPVRIRASGLGKGFRDQQAGFRVLLGRYAVGPGVLSDSHPRQYVEAL